MSMESRKVQLAGQSTYTISLPKEWAKAQGIETGQQLTLCPRDSGRLIVSTERATETTQPVVDIGGAGSEEAEEVLRALYAAGYDEFGVRADAGLSSDVRRAVTRTTTELVGLEVAAEDERTVRCRDLLDATEVSVPRVLSRLQFAALSAHRGATAALVEGDADRAERARRHRRDAAAEYALLERRGGRALTEVGVLDELDVSRAELLEFARIGEALDGVADLGTALAAALETAETRPEGAWCTAFSDVAQQTRLLVEQGVSTATSGPTVEQVEPLRDARREAAKGVAALREREDTPDSRLGYRAVDALERTTERGGRIREAVLGLAVRGAE